MTERKFHGLIDGDIILYECIAGKDDEVLAELCYAIDKRIKTLVEDAGVETYEIFLSGPKEVNYRYDVYPAYKAKRPPKPAHLVGAKQYMYDKLGAIETEVGENDDLLGRHAMSAFADAVTRWFESGSPAEDGKWFSKTLLMTTDKDLKMIPGWHYSWSPKSDHDWIWITLDEGYKWFFTQLLTGDSTDGIPGLKGVGPKAAEKALKDPTTNIERLQVCVERYVAKGHDLEYLFAMADLLWIQRDDRRGREFIRDLEKAGGYDLEGAFPQPDPAPKLVDMPNTATSEKFKSAKAKTSAAQEAFAKKDTDKFNVLKNSGTPSAAGVTTPAGEPGFFGKVEGKVTAGTDVVVEEDLKAGIIHRRWLPGTKEEHQAKIDAAKGEADLKAGIEGESIPADQKPDVSTYPDGTALEFNDDIPF